MCTTNSTNSPEVDPEMDSSTNQIYAVTFTEQVSNHVISYGSLSELDITVYILVRLPANAINQILAY